MSTPPVKRISPTRWVCGSPSVWHVEARKDDSNIVYAFDACARCIPFDTEDVKP
jgi:hypothetical protein